MDHQEAGQMWCPWRPLEFVSDYGGISNHRKNESYSLGTNSRCITFDCMAWRDGECLRLVTKD